MGLTLPKDPSYIFGTETSGNNFSEDKTIRYRIFIMHSKSGNSQFNLPHCTITEKITILKNKKRISTAYARHAECPLITDKQIIPMDWYWSFAITTG